MRNGPQSQISVQNSFNFHKSVRIHTRIHKDTHKDTQAKIALYIKNPFWTGSTVLQTHQSFHDYLYHTNKLKIGTRGVLNPKAALVRGQIAFQSEGFY